MKERIERKRSRKRKVSKTLLACLTFLVGFGCAPVKLTEKNYKSKCHHSSTEVYEAEVEKGKIKSLMFVYDSVVKDIYNQQQCLIFEVSERYPKEKVYIGFFIKDIVVLNHFILSKDREQVWNLLASRDGSPTGFKLTISVLLPILKEKSLDPSKLDNSIARGQTFGGRITEQEFSKTLKDFTSGQLLFPKQKEIQSQSSR